MQSAVKPQLESLPELGAFVEDSALFNHISRQEALILRNAVEEACGTIIRDGYPAKNPGVISINVEKMAQKARLIIRDDGRLVKFSEGLFKTRPAGFSEGGSEDGTHFTSEPVKIVSYEAMNGRGNQLVLEKDVAIPEQMETGSWIEKG